MSSNTNLSYKRAVRILTGACGLLFSAFSFIYLYLFQGDVLGALHYSLSQGKTHYSPLAGAIIITLVLFSHLPPLCGHCDVGSDSPALPFE